MSPHDCSRGVNEVLNEGRVLLLLTDKSRLQAFQPAPKALIHFFSTTKLRADKLGSGQGGEGAKKKKKKISRMA